jgi:hypothetical protein
LKLHDALLLQFSRQQLSLCITRSNLFQLFIIIGEETQILEGYVDVRVTTETALLFYRIAAAGECVLIDLFLTVDKMRFR